MAKEEIVKKAKATWVAAVVLFFVSIWFVVIRGLTVVSFPEQVRALGLAILPFAIGASLLFFYFQWRTRFVARMRSEAREHGKSLMQDALREGL